MVALLAPGLFPPVMQMAGGLVDVYFEAAAVITALVLLGQVLELRARSRTNEAIKLLYKELEKKNKELQKLDQLKSDFVSNRSCLSSTESMGLMRTTIFIHSSR